MDRDKTLVFANRLTLKTNRAILDRDGFTRRIVHPITGRFVAEYNPESHQLRITHRGVTALVDLTE